MFFKILNVITIPLNKVKDMVPSLSYGPYSYGNLLYNFFIAHIVLLTAHNSCFNLPSLFWFA
jgi:hypothetical protein